MTDEAARTLKILLDVNIYIGNIIATQNGRSETANQKLVVAARDGILNNLRFQLIASYEIVDTLRTVLLREGLVPEASVDDYVNTIYSFMRAGPLELEPYMVLGGKEQLDMKDREDAGVLATALAGRADLLVTENLKDFVTAKSQTLLTGFVGSEKGGKRSMQAINHTRANGTNLIVAHPFQVLDWSRQGFDLRAETLWPRLQDFYGNQSIASVEKIDPAEVLTKVIKSAKAEIRKERREEAKRVSSGDESEPTQGITYTHGIPSVSPKPPTRKI